MKPSDQQNQDILSIAGVIMSRDIFSSRHEGSSRVIDVGMQTVFLRILEELAERHTEELPDEANVSFIMATYMEVDQDSSDSLLKRCCTMSMSHYY